MCGIAGIVELEHGVPPEEAALRRMLGMIRHRGPDQFGIYLDSRAGLGNARLSIIDLAGGQQPIGNEDETLWVVFNGEIFNYVELRPTLEARGHRFRTQSDTEVLLHLYETHGPAFLNQLNGQFAMALWDARKQELLLARDRLGVRPVYYAWNGHRLVFASEIKAILAEGSVSRTLDPQALDQVFTYWSPLSPRTLLKDIRELPPGHFLVANRNGLTIKPYWQLSYFSPNGAALSEEEYTEELRDLLIDAARIRLRADVPVGAYLSGGLDSSTIAYMIRHFSGSRLDTFSITFDDQEFDESQYQREMAHHLGTDHHVLFARHADIGKVFPKVIWHTEAPIMRTSPAPMFLLSQLVRDHHYKVVLTGEGADEMLAGYDIFKEAKIRRFWAHQPGSNFRPRLLQRLYPDIARLGRNQPAYLAAFFGQGLEQVNAPDYSHAIRWNNNRRTRRFFSKVLLAAIAAADRQAPHLPHIPPEFDEWGRLEQAQYLESSIFLSQYLLSSQGDRVAMAHSVEGRFPFLDHRVVEFCNRLPSSLKLHGLTEKYLLKRVARDWLPTAIWKRPKRPYRAPIHRSFFTPTTPDYVDELLSSESVRAFGLFNDSAVTHLLSKLRKGQPLSETDDMALAGLISSQLFYHHFISNFRPTAALGDRDDVKLVNKAP